MHIDYKDLAKQNLKSDLLLAGLYFADCTKAMHLSLDESFFFFFLKLYVCYFISAICSFSF